MIDWGIPELLPAPSFFPGLCIASQKLVGSGVKSIPATVRFGLGYLDIITATCVD